MLAALGIAVAYLAETPGIERGFSFSLLAGAAFGIVLQRGRFCFFCNARDFFERRDPRGLLSIIVALATGVVGYAVIFGAWMPVPAPERLPPDAHIGPVSIVVALAAFAFGLGMAVSGSCISAHLYRLGEGSPTSIFALIGALIGFGLGFLSWNPLYLLLISEAPVIWLPHGLGYAASVALSLAVLAGLAILVARRTRSASGALEPEAPASPLHGALRRIFVLRWPAGITGLAVGIVSTFAYLRVGPLGVTAELGSISRTAATDWRVAPDTLYGLDGFRGCATAVKQFLLSENGLFVLGLIGGSLAAALIAGQFRPSWPRWPQMRDGVIGGILMGWGAMTALGCTIGTLLSGIHAGALSGWLFALFCLFGVWLGWRARLAYGRRFVQIGHST